MAAGNSREHLVQYWRARPHGSRHFYLQHGVRIIHLLESDLTILESFYFNEDTDGFFLVGNEKYNAGISHNKSVIWSGRVDGENL